MRDIAKPGTPLEETDPLRATLNASTICDVYEGLPHQLFEKKSLEREVKRDDVFWIYDFPFYTRKSDAIPKILDFFGNQENFEPWVMEKRCGGFHPDFAVTWNHDGSEASVLVCFGCHEVLYVHKGAVFRYDWKRDVDPTELFNNYSYNRPPYSFER